jgi:hypothetical protein
MNTTHDPFCDLAHLPPATVVDPEGTTTTWVASGHCRCEMLARVRKMERESTHMDIVTWMNGETVNEIEDVQDRLYTFIHMIKSGNYAQRAQW